MKADLDGQSRWIASLGSQSETNSTGFEVFEILTGLGGVDENDIGLGDARIGQTICPSLVVCATPEIDPATHDVVISFHCGHFAHHVMRKRIFDRLL